MVDTLANVKTRSLPPPAAADRDRNDAARVERRAPAALRSAPAAAFKFKHVLSAQGLERVLSATEAAGESPPATTRESWKN